MGGIDLRCGAGQVAALAAALRYPKKRSVNGFPYAFSTAAEIARRLFLPPAAATHNSPGTPFTPAPVRFPIQRKNKAPPDGGALFLVEMGGIEPPSESALTGTSPGADGRLHSLVRARAVTLRGLVAS